jgi:hypothetical protein
MLMSNPLRLSEFLSTAERLAQHLQDGCDRGDFLDVARALVTDMGVFNELKGQWEDMKITADDYERQTEDLLDRVNELEAALESAGLAVP